ncbi:MAG TPA: hypothetical protein VMS92_19000 [Mycobacterium sp.]|nr:hypothetical protein [Mycobacterium sp.]
MTTAPASGAWNTDDINGWEFNGSGTNLFPIQPEAVDFFVSARPLILTEDMLSLFDDECPDMVISAEFDTITIPAEIEEMVIL